MSLIEAALKKMSKDEALTLKYQAKSNSILANIVDLKPDFRSIFRTVCIYNNSQNI